MHWIAPSESDTDNAALEKRFWVGVEQAVPAPHFAEAEYSARPEGLLGLIFLRFAEVRFSAQRAKLERAILDPACGSGGMFVSSARFVSELKKNPAAELSVHGLEGELKHGGNINSYYDDPHVATGRFDFVQTN